MLAGIDSMVLIFSGMVPRKKSAKSEEYEEMKTRSKILLHKLQKETIVLPTVAIAELLVPVHPDKKGELTAVLSGMFLCHPFDLNAATIASDLWEHHKTLPKSLIYSDRHVLKADILIVASAKSAGATEFYSHDKKCRALANKVMKACDLPSRDPDDMFLAGDIRRGEV